MKIEIDGRKFPKLNNPQRYSDAPAAFSGGKLHNLRKTVIFLMPLSAGDHEVDFVPNGRPRLESIEIYHKGAKTGFIAWHGPHQSA